MKFKLCQCNSKSGGNSLSIVANPSRFSPTDERIECPEDPSGHIYYPIPESLKSEVVEYLNNSLLQEKQEIFAEYENQIRQIINKRKQAMNNLRTELNPEILNKIHSFKEDNPELFI